MPHRQRTLRLFGIYQKINSITCCAAFPLPKKYRVQPSFFGSPVYVRLAQFFRKKNIRPMFRKIPCGSIEMFVRLARGWWSGTLPLPKKYRVQPLFFGSPVYVRHAQLFRKKNNFYVTAAAMVAGGNRLSLTGAVAETGTAEQGTAI